MEVRKLERWSCVVESSVMFRLPATKSVPEVSKKLVVVAKRLRFRMSLIRPKSVHGQEEDVADQLGFFQHGDVFFDHRSADLL